MIYILRFNPSRSRAWSQLAWMVATDTTQCNNMGSRTKPRAKTIFLIMFHVHVILFKFPHALLTQVDQNEAKHRLGSQVTIIHLSKGSTIVQLPPLSQVFSLKLAVIQQLLLFPAFYQYNCWNLEQPRDNLWLSRC